MGVKVQMCEDSCGRGKMGPRRRRFSAGADRGDEKARGRGITLCTRFLFDPRPVDGIARRHLLTNHPLPVSTYFSPPLSLAALPFVVSMISGRLRASFTRSLYAARADSACIPPPFGARCTGKAHESTEDGPQDDDDDAGANSKDDPSDGATKTRSRATSTMTEDNPGRVSDRFKHHTDSARRCATFCHLYYIL